MPTLGVSMNQIHTGSISRRRQHLPNAALVDQAAWLALGQRRGSSLRCGPLRGGISLVLHPRAKAETMDPGRCGPGGISDNIRRSGRGHELRRRTRDHQPLEAEVGLDEVTVQATVMVWRIAKLGK